MGEAAARDEAAVPRAARRRLQELVTFLATTGQSAEDRVGWFLHVNDLLDYARRADSRERETILRAFDDCNNLVMNAYAALERIAPNEPTLVIL